MIPTRTHLADEGRREQVPYNGRYIFMSDNEWMVSEAELLNDWLARALKDLVNKKVQAPFKPSIKAFQNLIESDGEVYLGFHRIFEGLPQRPSTGSPAPEVSDILMTDRIVCLNFCVP